MHFISCSPLLHTARAGGQHHCVVGSSICLNLAFCLACGESYMCLMLASSKCALHQHGPLFLARRAVVVSGWAEQMSRDGMILLAVYVC
jgi:hypothetical protein